MPGRRDREGEDDGAILFRTRLHPMSCAGASWLAAFILFVGTLIIRHNDLSKATDVRIAAASGLLAVLALLGPILRLARSEFAVTRSRFLVRTGLGGARTEIGLRDVTQLDVHAGSLGRYLDYGTVTVTMRDDDVLVFHHVAAPGALREAMRGVAARR